MGQGADFLDAFKDIVRRLETDPFDFAEPLFRLPNLKLRVRHGSVRPLVVDFAIHDDEAIVFVKGLKLLGEAR